MLVRIAGNALIAAVVLMAAFVFFRVSQTDFSEAGVKAVYFRTLEGK